nr:MAG TPA: hypothetical protein [Caudoviricetes sp.]
MKNGKNKLPPAQNISRLFPERENGGWARLRNFLRKCHMKPIPPTRICRKE